MKTKGKAINPSAKHLLINHKDKKTHKNKRFYSLVRPTKL
jgi:hypothetical protein